MRRKILFSSVVVTVVLFFGWITMSGFSKTDLLVKNAPNKKVELVEKEELIFDDNQTNKTSSTKTENDQKDDKPKKNKVNKKDKKKENDDSDIEKQNKSESRKEKSVEKSEPKKKVEPKKEAPKFVTEKMSGEFMSTVDLNIRKGPSTDFEAVGYLKAYGKAVASEKTNYQDNTWYKITYNGVTGWASAGYLKNYKEESKTKETSSDDDNSKSTTSNQYKANHIYFNGRSVPYKNGGKANGQAIIDSSNYASTWGGASTFSGTDGKNTHFIGHSPGNFTGVQNAKSFVVTDGNGTPFTYYVTRVYRVDSYGVGTNDGKNYFDRIAGTGGGERITIQTCVIGANDNWIIEAHP